MKFAHSPNIDSAKQILQQIAQNPVNSVARKVDKPLVLYGAGDMGRMARQSFDQVGISFKYVVDSNPEPHRNDPFGLGLILLAQKMSRPKNAPSLFWRFA